MQTLLNTLYVSTPYSYLHLDNDTIRVEVERETRLRVPLHHLGGVVLFGNVLVSPPLIHRLADEGKSLVLLSEHGRFKARLEGPISGNILLRQAQHARAADAAFTLGVARACVAGKIRMRARSSCVAGARPRTATMAPAWHGAPTTSPRRCAPCLRPAISIPSVASKARPRGSILPA